MTIFPQAYRIPFQDDDDDGLIAWKYCSICHLPMAKADSSFNAWPINSGTCCAHCNRIVMASQFRRKLHKH
jgi:hypothetical protein